MKNLLPKTRQGRRNCGGFTAAEIVVSSAILAIVATAVMLFMIYATRSFAAITNYVDLDGKSRNALDLMIREVREAREVTSYSPQLLTVKGSTNQILTYSLNASTHQFFRSVNGKQDAKPLLSGCEQLTFKIYQRTPSANHEFYEVATNAAQCKLVNVSWLCSRSILGKKINTESVQTTKIVIRNQKVQS
jgi:hypothetical protein